MSPYLKKNSYAYGIDGKNARNLIEFERMTSSAKEQGTLSLTSLEMIDELYNFLNKASLNAKPYKPFYNCKFESKRLKIIDWKLYKETNLPRFLKQLLIEEVTNTLPTNWQGKYFIII